MGNRRKLGRLKLTSGLTESEWVRELEHIDNQLTHVLDVFNFLEELFRLSNESEAALGVFNTTPLFWHVFRDCMQESMFMGLGRLCDPPSCAMCRRLSRLRIKNDNRPPSLTHQGEIDVGFLPILFDNRQLGIPRFCPTAIWTTLLRQAQEDGIIIAVFVQIFNRDLVTVLRIELFPISPHPSGCLPRSCCQAEMSVSYRQRP
jgi:AbiU2